MERWHVLNLLRWKLSSSSLNLFAIGSWHGHPGTKDRNTQIQLGWSAFIMGDMPLYLGAVLKESVLHVFLSLHLIATSNKSELQVQLISNDKFFDVLCRRHKVTNIHTFNDLHGRLALVPLGHQCCSRVKPRQDGRWRKHSSILSIWSMKHLTTPPTTTEAGANESREDDQKAKNNQHLSLPNRPQEQSSKEIRSQVTSPKKKT